MQKVRDILSRPAVTAVLLACAALCFAAGAISVARAALTEESEIYAAHVETQSIGVALLENDAVVEGKDALLSTLLGDDASILPGKVYPEVLSVQNTGTIDEFVRVTVRAYWLDSSGAKAPLMDSALIHLGFVTDGGWTIDDEATTEERTVLYLGTALAPGQASTPFLESVGVDASVTYRATQTTTTAGGLTTVTTVWTYGGYSLCLDVTAEGVQTHSADEAVKSAWGTEVRATASSLSLG